MKAPTRPNVLLAALVVASLGFSLVGPFGVRLTEAKTRTEIQLGDPTDTDEGPAPSPGAAKTLAAQFRLARSNRQSLVLSGPTRMAIFAYLLAISTRRY
jgi:hypothetical protein